jgi:hypothetical protein
MAQLMSVPKSLAGVQAPKTPKVNCVEGWHDHQCIVPSEWNVSSESTRSFFLDGSTLVRESGLF